MCKRTIIGFHACRSVGEPCFPFLSNDHEKTWLTQGYYFWTDTDSWARFWGKRSVSKSGSYRVLECKIALEDDELLDLVGNARHLELFSEMIRYVSGKTSLPIVTVRTVLKFLRAEEAKEPGTFPFLAIKAADYPKTDYKFVEKMNEKLATLNRQQLCVFEQAKARIALINSKVYQE